MPAVVLWLRRDLRSKDLPALTSAAQQADGHGVLPLFVVDPVLWDGAGPARQHWLAESLEALADGYGGALTIRVGHPDAVVPRVAAEAGAVAVHVTAESSPFGRRRDRRVSQALQHIGVDLVRSGTPYAVPPGTVLSGAGTPYRVYTPFFRSWVARVPRRAVPAPLGTRWVTGIHRDTLPTPAGRRPQMPAAGERAAAARWRTFVEQGLDAYDAHRDRPDLDGTSQLSAHLHFGELHPRTLLADLEASGRAASPGARRFVAELAWREFYADVLYHRPDSAWADLRDTLRGMAYDDPGVEFDAWREGRTGYPLVDAGMRQLIAEGWMHNRSRMVTASFLVKDLHVWWGHGARHFLAHLRDGDVASNTHGWQWVAGTGTDPAPYFRIFNPTSQAQRFDPEGDYVRRYVPELGHLPGASVHEPWSTPGGYDGGYPRRVVDHAQERREALSRYDAVR